MSADDWNALRYEASQLFTPSLPIRTAELFAGRSAEIRKILDVIYEAGQHAILYGERGVGKTSLAQVVRFLLPSRTSRVIFVREQADPSDSFSSLWKKVFSNLKTTIRRNGEETEASISELYDTEVVPSDIARELDNFSLNTVPIIVLDEFNEIKDNKAASYLANTIKALSDRGVNCTVIVVGVADNVTELIEEHASISRCMTEIKMPRMSNPEAQEILDKRLGQLGMTIDPTAKWTIVVLSRGLPSYVHRLGRYAVLRCINDRQLEATEEHVKSAIDEVLERSQESIKDSYETATHSNQPGNLFRQVLLACAMADADDSGWFKPVDVCDPIASILKRKAEIATFQNHLTDFCSSKRGNILERKGSERAYRFRFTDPIMQPFVIMQGIRQGFMTKEARTILRFPEQLSFDLST
jgi:Cdc6-like AAA superfamily ATPase